MTLSCLNTGEVSSEDMVIFRDFCIIKLQYFAFICGKILASGEIC